MTKRSQSFARLRALTVAALFVYGCSDASLDEQNCETMPPAPPAGICDSISLDPTFPGDVSVDPNSVPLDQAQAMFDCMSWQTFVALNYPAQQGCRGTPDLDAGLANDTNLRVWETWKEVFEVFQDEIGGWNPADQTWNEPVPNVACSDMAQDRKVVRLTSKGVYGPDEVTESEQAFATSFGVLRDQANNLVRYEIRFNRDEFEAVRDSGFAATGTYNYGGPILPDGEIFILPDNRDGATGHGSMELKASWKILTSADDPSRYYTQEVIIHDEGGDPECSVEQMGLLGLHIMHKTYHAPQWSFATFEHRDNTPPAGSIGDGRDYSLFSEECALNTPDNCWAIQPPIADESLVCCPNLEFNTGIIPATPTQATRIVPVGAPGLNERYQRALADAGSVLQYYHLVNTQFTLGGRDPANPERVRQYFCNPNGAWAIPPASEDCFTQVPANLRNTSMETYMASYGTGTTELPADSCLNCHAAGGVDMSYIWLDAKIAPVSLQ